MAKKIHEYSKERTAITIKGDDLMDIDSTDDLGLNYESAKMKFQEFINKVNNSIINIYSSNGTLLTPRIVAMNGNSLLFAQGVVRMGSVPVVSDENLRVIKANVDKIESEGTNNTLDRQIKLKGTFDGQKYIEIGDITIERNGLDVALVFPINSGKKVTNGNELAELYKYNESIDGNVKSFVREFITKITTEPEQKTLVDLIQKIHSHYAGSDIEMYSILRTGVGELGNDCFVKLLIFTGEIPQEVWTGHSSSIFETHGGRKNKTRFVSASVSLNYKDHVIFIDTEEAITITLPENKDGIEIKLVRVGGGGVATIVGASGNINGLANLALSSTLGHTTTLIGNGTDWFGNE